MARKGSRGTRIVSKKDREKLQKKKVDETGFVKIPSEPVKPLAVDPAQQPITPEPSGTTTKALPFSELEERSTIDATTQLAGVSGEDTKRFAETELRLGELSTDIASEQAVEDSKWAGARQETIKNADGTWTVEFFTMVDNPTGGQDREVLETMVLTGDQKRTLADIQEKGFSVSNDPVLQKILDNQLRIRGTPDVSENVLREEIDKQKEAFDKQMEEIRSIASSTFTEGLWGAFSGAIIGAGVGLLAAGPAGALAGAGKGLAKSTIIALAASGNALISFQKAFEANEKESVAVTSAKFKEAKSGLNSIPTYVNSGALNPYLAEIMYAGGLRRIRAYKGQLKSKEANNLIADISNYDTPMGKIEEYLSLRAPSILADIQRKKVDRNHVMADAWDAEDMENMGIIDSSKLGVDINQ